MARFRSLAKRSADTPKYHVIDRHVGSSEAPALTSSESGALTLAVLVDANRIPLGINDINVLEDNTGDVTVLRALELASSVRAGGQRRPFHRAFSNL